MKKIIAAILVLVFALAMSGCVKITYWDGMTKQEAKDYICKELEEKYGEEFVVISIGTRSGQYYSELVAECSPKSDKDIVFRIEVNHFSESRMLYDNYIQNVVRKQIKLIIDENLSQRYDTFASEVYVTPQVIFYDSGIRSAGDATIKSFSESFKQADGDEDYRTSVWIVLSNKESDDIDKLKSVIEEISTEFYSLKVYINCFFSDQETIDLCNEKANEITTDHFQVMNITSRDDLKQERFIYYNDNRGLIYIGNNID